LLGGIIGGGAAAAMGYSLVSREGVIDEWVTVGPVADLPTDRPQRTNVTVTERGRFMESEVGKVVWLRRNEDGSVQALSGACPHMNCTVAWRAEQNGFDCACHVSNFDATGRVVSGPSPRPLDALEQRVENGILSLRYQKFRQSVPEKEPIV
jgi:Rieske Fe-S protein